MKPEDQRIAIAEACGWTDIGQRLHCSSGKNLTDAYSYLGGVPPYPDLDVDWEINSLAIPNYLHDLNAMWEAENALPEDLRFEYHNHLFDILPCDENHGPAVPDGEDVVTPSAWTILHATAEQRAEAFLKAKGLWKDNC